jgi:hypothetical protein
LKTAKANLDGPPLSDVKVKPPEALLSDILDPNRIFEARWSAYTIETNVRPHPRRPHPKRNHRRPRPRHARRCQRNPLKDMKSLDRTLMPDGLEAAISKEQMSDLIAFLLGK